MVLFRPLGRWRPTSFSGVFRRRRLAVGMASDAERLTTGPTCYFLVFLVSLALCRDRSGKRRVGEKC
jgi:hypothetical protein